MNWYMKHEGTGAIAGPMTKDEALEIADNGLIFSENIFSPEIVTTSEVEDVLTSLRVLCGLTQEDRDFNQLLEEITVVSQRAIDTITLLSQKQGDTTSEVEDCLTDMRASQSYRPSGIMRKAIEMITLLSAKKVVRGVIQGGVLDVQEVSEGVEVDIRDYDTDGVDEDNLEEDETGTHFRAG